MKISRNLNFDIQLALRMKDVNKARDIVARAWKRHLQEGKTQLTCNKWEAENIYSQYLTDLLIEAKVFELNSTTKEITRTF